ncbi:MAG: hypothetical protein D6797_06130 [Bdellovibrio sp.]|nr:MAG: hypothetical protein D6797_06130 [Bdellovibrio sp.]
MKKNFFILCFFFPFSLQALCVSSSKAFLRKGPGRQYPISWVVGRYMPLVKIKSQGFWYQVRDVDGVKHWIHRRLVTNRYQCLVVRVNVSTLHLKPGPKTPLATPPIADRYTPFKYLDTEEDWFYIQNQFGKKFWISRQHVWRPRRVLRLSF